MAGVRMDASTSHATSRIRWSRLRIASSAATEAWRRLHLR